MKYKVKKDDLELNLAPMIDVVFLLLIFFIVASTLNIREVKENIQLPKTQAREEKNSNEVKIYITKEANIYLGKDKVELEDLALKLEEKLKDNSQKNISIFADQQVAFQEVIGVMDAAKKADVDNLSFALEEHNE
ncbi:ExbD/TolR family protein [Orenia marismortui]|uniref:ExbD/TolR family protein n=1 Tax=Orenia marismortui TaxID=46469 RepID=UPI000381FD5D|nr:biopolymer transporter ExbD [Orenia marismortui]